MCERLADHGRESSALRELVFHFVTGRDMPSASHSWKASVPITAVATWPLMHSTGIESLIASSRPGDGVADAGAGGHQHDADPAGAARIAFGRVHGGLLMAHQDVPQRGWL